MYRFLLTGFIAGVFLLSGTELHQLLRLPSLISHYKLHRQQDASLSVWEFLQLHYAGNHPEDNDEQDDAGLPFKSPGGINHLDQILAYSPPAMDRPYAIPSSGFISCFKDGRPCSRMDGIFRPPRLV